MKRTALMLPLVIFVATVAVAQSRPAHTTKYSPVIWSNQDGPVISITRMTGMYLADEFQITVDGEKKTLKRTASGAPGVSENDCNVEFFFTDGSRLWTGTGRCGSDGDFAILTDKYGRSTRVQRQK